MEEVRPPSSLENGTELRRRQRTGGLGDLTVQNGSSGDAIVNLVDSTKNRVIRSFYVRSNMSFTEKGIRPGTYEIYFSTGSDWNPGARSFDHDAEYFQFGHNLDFSEHESQETGKVEYHKFEITLQPVVGGTVQSSSINRQDFEQMMNQSENAFEQ
jgi:hypothetical protein